ncbi:DUF3293 domain-containing protein [Planctomycetota bacterium]|nr:DUF3293 domain-containing protein [Planctomycetota bacterium]
MDLPQDSVLPMDAPLTEALNAVLDHHFCLLEGEPAQVITLADLARPASALWAFGIVLSLEAAITRLVPSYSEGRWWRERKKDQRNELKARRRRLKERDSYLTDIDSLYFREKLQLGCEYLEGTHGLAKDALSRLEPLNGIRNDLAHGRPLGHSGKKGPREALRCLQAAASTAGQLWGMVRDRPQIWDAMLATEIRYHGNKPQGEAWLISAQNPGEAESPSEDNRIRHEQLVEVIRGLGLHAGEATGTSAAGRDAWSEDMVLFAGPSATEEQARELARQFGKRAIFRVNGCYLAVIDAQTGAVRGERTFPSS